MKKVSLLIVFISLTFLLLGCNEANVYDITTIQEFDEMIKLNDAVRYDLRSSKECEKGHIPRFMCMRTIDENGNLKELDEIIKNIKIIYDKDKTIILIADDEETVKEVADKLTNNGYRNICYFKDGYQKYKEAKGDSFIPEEGCNC